MPYVFYLSISSLVLLRDTLISVSTQTTEEKGAKEAKEIGKGSQVNAGIVESRAIRLLNVSRRVEVAIKAKAKVGKVEKVPPWQ